MENLAFICHANEDAVVANKVVAGLENAGINCWIAPRNIPLGTTYAASIVQGIRRSNYIIFIFSKASNNSDAVVNEIENASDLKKPIITFKIDNDDYSDSLNYYLRSKQSVNAYHRPHNEAVAELIQAITGNKVAVEPSPAPSRKKNWMIPVGILIVAAIGFGIYFMTRSGKPKTTIQSQVGEAKPTETEKYEPPPITMSFLEGTWKVEWTISGSSAVETATIDKNGGYIVGGAWAFNITKFDYDKNANLITFTKEGIADSRILENTLSIKNENLLEGTEANYNVIYTRMSAVPK